MPTILLWLLVINLGVAFGAGLYEHRIVVSRWIRASSATGVQWDAAAARQDDTGRRFWGFVTTGPLTLLTLANVIVAWRSTGAVRSWWLAAAGTALADRLFTFSYFIPTMIRLMRATDTARTGASAQRWANLNYLRHVWYGRTTPAGLYSCEPAKTFVPFIDSGFGDGTYPVYYLMHDVGPSASRPCFFHRGHATFECRARNARPNERLKLPGESPAA